MASICFFRDGIGLEGGSQTRALTITMARDEVGLPWLFDEAYCLLTYQWWFLGNNRDSWGRRIELGERAVC